MPVRAVLLALTACFALASAATAAPVSLAPIQLSAELQETIAEDYGAREEDVLRGMVERAVSDALTRVGGQIVEGGPIVIEITLVDARPNRPTLGQATHRPGLDFGRSLSIGGADLTATLRHANGASIGDVQYDYYTPIIEDAVGASTWSDAQRAIRRFARRVAEAYARAD